MLTLVRTDLAPKGGHRVLLFIERGVIPALDRGQTELDPLAADGGTPLLGSQLFEPGLKFSPLGRGGQQRAHYAEAEARPLFMGTWEERVVRHRIAHFSFFGSCACDVRGSTTAPAPVHLASCAGHNPPLT